MKQFRLGIAVLLMSCLGGCAVLSTQLTPEQQAALVKVCAAARVDQEFIDGQLQTVVDEKHKADLQRAHDLIAATLQYCAVQGAK